MRVLVGFEASGIVRDAFRARGHDAISCDLKDSERPGPHIRCDIRDLERAGYYWDSFDLAILFPECRYLCGSGLHWNTRRPDRLQLTTEALDLVRWCFDRPVKRLALENSVGLISTAIRKPDQIVQPHQFGHPESKTTCFWLLNLPLLVPTNILQPTRWQDNGRPRWDNQTGTGQNKLGPSPTRSADRARTYPGIADAMADQWGSLSLEGF